MSVNADQDGHREHGRWISAATLSDQAVVWLLSSIAFLNALGSIIVFPLGPFFAQDLGTAAQDVGFASASYSLAAAAGGFGASFVLDRFDRRAALLVVMTGFLLATALSGFAPNFGTLVATRALAGLFVGPMTGLLLAIVTDTVPLNRRGAAVSKMIGAYGVALVFGVPAGVAIASTFGGWRFCFFGIALVGAPLFIGALRLLAPQREHLAALKPWRLKERARDFWILLTSGPSLLSFLLIASASYAALLISPNLPTYLTHNLGLPREKLQEVYFLGGVFTLVALPLTGRLIDLAGARLMAVGVAVIMTGLLAAAFLTHTPPIPNALLFALIVVFQLIRSTINQAWVTRVPAIQERAAFQTLIAVATNLAQAAGAATAPALLAQSADGRLEGMGLIAAIAIASAWAAPLLLAALDRLLASPVPKPGPDDRLSPPVIDV
ncbi:MFS transporter [Methylopila sp. Yamaguchi]|uniref:MFS transporter n=1 Tax=Methylopila sp. Yamaguchi TaxID=1437817 RepID=UPI000CA84D5F|nr:MFS transporter [Methylopila sp. Yamaguchi]GBD48734.1 multidrug resistance protein [Methylopila sp. Yamaguchi]